MRRDYIHGSSIPCQSQRANRSQTSKPPGVRGRVREKRACARGGQTAVGGADDGSKCLENFFVLPPRLPVRLLPPAALRRDCHCCLKDLIRERDAHGGWGFLSFCAPRRKDIDIWNVSIGRGAAARAPHPDWHFVAYRMDRTPNHNPDGHDSRPRVRLQK